MNVADEMRKKLQKAFAPQILEIVDDSERHRGHAGYQEGGQSHFNITINSAVFTPMNRLERHRAVHSALGKELVSRIHALSLQINA